MAENNNNKNGFYYQVILLVVAVMLGGTQPFWWPLLFSNGTQIEHPKEKSARVSSEQVTLDQSEDNASPSEVTEVPPIDTVQEETPLQTSDTEKAKSSLPVTRTVRVDPTKITATSSNTRIDLGDDEIDSDDWTSVELYYNIEMAKNEREILLEVIWFAQERNSDRTPGNTRFKSFETFTLFKADQHLTGAIIKDIEGLELSAKKEEYYRGRVHGFVPFPNAGSLNDIKVQFDGPGRRDDQKQALIAVLSGYKVVLSANPPSNVR